MKKKPATKWLVKAACVASALFAATVIGAPLSDVSAFVQSTQLVDGVDGAATGQTSNIYPASIRQ